MEEKERELNDLLRWRESNKWIRFKTNMKNSKGLKKLYWRIRFNVINKKYIKRYE